MAIYRDHPVLFGMLIAFIGMALVFVSLEYDPSFERFLSENTVWVLMGAYTATLFGSLVSYFRPRHWSTAFWGLLAALLILHMACLIAFIHHVRPLRGIDYILFGPIEGLVIALLLTRGVSSVS
jgi:hypothetical protein